MRSSAQYPQGRHGFQGALAERGIPLYTVEMLDEDLQTVRDLRQR